MATQPAITVGGDFSSPIYREALADEAPMDRVLEAARVIVGRLEGLAREQVRLKSSIEVNWLEDTRNYWGRYETALWKELDDAERSTAFVKLTRNKTNGWIARLFDLLFPTDDKNWGIKPTPLPKLIAAAKQAQQAAEAAVEQANAAAEQQDPRARMLAEQAGSYAQAIRQTQAEMDEAKKRCDAMQAAIDDQLVESDYVSQCRDLIEDGCRLGTGILKGPLVSSRLREEWRPVEVDAAPQAANDRYELAKVADPQPMYVRVDPWHFFPDMSARTIAEAEFTFERSLPTKKDLRTFARKLGFNENAVRRLLREGAESINATDINHITELRSITGEGQQIKDRYVMWEYHGPLETEEVAILLRAAGQDELAREYLLRNDPLDEHRVILHFANNEVLNISDEYPMDNGETLYSVWNFERGETSIFGIGVPRIMSDSQRAINGASRMMLDNSALSVGPQVVIDKVAIQPADQVYEIRSLKVWYKNPSATASNPQNPPFQVYNIPNNQAHLAGIIELFRGFADEETSLPLIAQGEAGAHAQPVGTTSMLFNSANVVFRRVVKSFDDDLTKPTIRRAYHWNMQHNPDPNVKGDMQVDARGTSVLLVREIQSQNLMNIMTNWTVHPVIGDYVKVREGLVKAVQTMMIPPDDILHDQETAEQKAQARAQAQAESGGMDPASIRLQAVEREVQGRVEIATMQRDIEVMRIAMKENLTIAQVRAQLEQNREKIASAERRHAADIAVEENRAANARATGVPEFEAVGREVG